jgi:chromosome segregation ATPase
MRAAKEEGIARELSLQTQVAELQRRVRQANLANEDLEGEVSQLRGELAATTRGAHVAAKHASNAFERLTRGLRSDNKAFCHRAELLEWDAVNLPQRAELRRANEEPVWRVIYVQGELGKFAELDARFVRKSRVILSL